MGEHVGCKKQQDMRSEFVTLSEAAEFIGLQELPEKAYCTSEIAPFSSPYVTWKDAAPPPELIRSFNTWVNDLHRAQSSSNAVVFEHGGSFWIFSRVVYPEDKCHQYMGYRVEKT